MSNNVRKLSKNDILKAMECYDRYPYMPFWWIVKEISENGYGIDRLNYEFKYGYGHPDKGNFHQSYSLSKEQKDIYRYMENYIDRKEENLPIYTPLHEKNDYMPECMNYNEYQQALKERNYWREARMFINNNIPQEYGENYQQEQSLRQARRFGRKAYKYVGEIIAKNNWSSSDPRAIAMHGVIGGTIAKMCGKNYIQGEELGKINKAIVAQIYENRKTIGMTDQDVIDFSEGLGEDLGTALGLGKQLGKEIAEMATRWNQTGGGSNKNSYFTTDENGYPKFVYRNIDNTIMGNDGNTKTVQFVADENNNPKFIYKGNNSLFSQTGQDASNGNTGNATQTNNFINTNITPVNTMVTTPQQNIVDARKADRDYVEQQTIIDNNNKVLLEAQRQDEQAKWAAQKQQSTTLATGFATPRGPSNLTAPNGPKGPFLTISSNNTGTTKQKLYDEQYADKIAADMEAKGLTADYDNLSGLAAKNASHFGWQTSEKQNAIATAMGVNWQYTNWNNPQNRNLWDKITSKALDLNYDYVVIGRKYVDNIVKWIKDTGQSWEDFGDRLDADQAVDYAKIMLKSQGVSETDTDYNQKLIEQALQFQQINETAKEMAFSFSGSLKISSLIKNETNLIRAAEQMCKNMNAKKEANILIARFLNNNTNPGKGSRNLFKDIYYLRGDKGARVFYRMTNKGVEILAKADKSNETAVIKILEKIYK